MMSVSHEREHGWHAPIPLPTWWHCPCFATTAKAACSTHLFSDSDTPLAKTTALLLQSARFSPWVYVLRSGRCRCARKILQRSAALFDRSAIYCLTDLQSPAVDRFVQRLQRSTALLDQVSPAVNRFVQQSSSLQRSTALLSMIDQDCCKGNETVLFRIRRKNLFLVLRKHVKKNRFKLCKLYKL